MTYMQRRIYGKEITHRGQKVLLCLFKYDKKYIEIFKSIGARYTATYKGWYVPVFKREEIIGLFPHIELEQSVPISIEPDYDVILTDEVKNEINQYIVVLKAANFSENSIKTYKGHITSFFVYHGKTDFHTGDILKYLAHLRDKAYSANSIRQVRSALKKYSDTMMIKDVDFNKIPFPRKSSTLPKVLSTQDIKRMIEVTHNLKHKAIISCLYSTGIRKGELLRLKVIDIDGQRNTIFIRNSKGNKDRIVPLSDMLKRLLRKYYIAYTPGEYLFEGEKGGPYSDSSVNNIIRASAARANIHKRVSAHMLRHSYATHLMEKGTNLRYIQELLGHKSSRTTEIYTKVTSHSLSNLPNPLDSLFDENLSDLPF